MIADLPFKYRLLILCVIALVSTVLVYAPTLKIAKSKNITDTPEDRKLQKVPVPVMGGIAVFFGIIVGLSFYKTLITYTSLFPVLSAMMIMLYIGAIDDCIGIKPSARFAIEIIVCLLICFGMKSCINCFQGFLGVEDTLPRAVAIPLTVITFIGIVNAVNMIDGVDGLSSGMCIFILGFFGLYFFFAHDYSYAALSAVSIGALLPFLLHNIFGGSSKMFIGDSGTMMIATAIAAMVIRVLNAKFVPDLFNPVDFSRIGFVLALLSIPVADTLRVMAVRISRHRSPFMPDNNHFHHILIKLHFPPLMIAVIEVGMSFVVLLSLVVSWLLGASGNLQIVIVIAVAAVLNWLGATILCRSLDRGGRLSRALTRAGDRCHRENSRFWRAVQRLLDKSSL